MDILSNPFISIILNFLSAGIGGVLGTWWTNRLKKNTDIYTFRYTKLYELSCELNNLEPIICNLPHTQNTLNHITNESSKKYSKIQNILNKTKPLIKNTNDIRNVSAVFSKTDELMSEFIKKANDRDKDLQEFYNFCYKLYKAQEDCEKELKEIINETLKDIIK